MCVCFQRWKSHRTSSSTRPTTIPSRSASHTRSPLTCMYPDLLKSCFTYLNFFCMYSIRPPGPGEIKRREVEMNSREELDNHLRVQGDQEEGGGAGPSWRVGQSFVGPGEIKRREVELDHHRELDSHLQVQAKSREVMLDPQESPGEIKRREVELDRHWELDSHLQVQVKSREVMLDPQESPGEIKRREVELDRHWELDSHLQVQVKSREVMLDPQESPGEIKRREVELDRHWELDSHLQVQVKSREVMLDPQESPGVMKSREVELDRHWELDSPWLQLLRNSCFSDPVTLRCTAVEAAVSKVRELLCTGGVSTSLTLLFCWWMTVSLVFVGRRVDKLSMFPPPPAPLFACP